MSAEEISKARIVFEVDKRPASQAVAQLNREIAGLGKPGATAAQGLDGVGIAAKKATEAIRGTGRATNELAGQAKAARAAEAQAQREAAAARKAAASEAKAQHAAQLGALKAEAAAVREQQQVLRALGGDAKQLHDLRLRELAILERAAKLAGSASQAASVRGQASAERARYSTAQEAQRSKAFGEAGSGVDTATKATSQLKATLEASAAPAAALGRQLMGFGLAAAGIGAVGGALGMVLQAVDQLSADSLKAQRVSANLQFSIEGASKAFGGYVDNVSLAQSANKAYAMGVVKTGKEFEDLSRGVNAIALQFGEDATALLDNAVTAVGRQSRLILDNLGIILDNAKAEQIFAESIGKTTAQLTAYEKEIAFSQAALLLIKDAGDQASVAIDGMAAKVQKGKVALENYRQGVLGFNNQIGATREALRALTDQELERLGYGYAAAIDGSTAAGRAFDDMLAHAGAYEQYAKELKKPVDQLTEAEKAHAESLVNTGVRLEDVKRLAMELGLTYDQLIEQEAKRREQEGAKQAKKEQDAETRAYIKALRDQADELDHSVAMMEILGATEVDNLSIMLEALDVRRQAAEAEFELTGEIDKQNEALKYQRQMELLQLKSDTGKLDRKRGSGKQGPSEADRIKAEGDARIAAMDAAASREESLARLRGSAEADAQALAERRLQITRATLDLEIRVAEATKARTSVDVIQREAKIAAAQAERQQAELDYLIEAREREIALSRARKAAIVEAADAERAAVYDLAAFKTATAAEQLRMQEAAALRGVRSEDERAAIKDGFARKSHALVLKQIEDERRAREADLDARKRELESSLPETEAEWIQRLADLRQLEHDREMLRLESERDMRRAVADEQQRLAQEAEASLARQIEMIGTALSTIESVHGQLEGYLSDYRGRKNAAEAAELEQFKARLTAGSAAQQAALDEQLAAAQGNASATAKIQRQKAALERTTQERIRKAQADHDRKIEREQQRSEGIKLLITGAVETVRAAAAYPNIPEMIAHAAAAAMAYSYGGMLLAGKLPGGGGAGSASMASSGAGGSLAAPTIERETSDASRTPDSIPGGSRRDRFTSPHAAANDRGGTVNVSIGNISTLGSFDAAAAEQIGKIVQQASYQREGAKVKVA